MTAGSPDRPDVEALLRDHLHDRSLDVDPTKILAGVRARQAVVQRPSRRKATRWTAVAAAAAIVLAVSTWVWRGPQSVQADPLKLVHEARQALAATDEDRAYKIQVDLAPGMGEQAPFLAALATADCRLWARQGRFRVEARQGGWACGRDERRWTWLAPSPDVGLDFAPEEVPRPLDEALELLSFDLDSTLHVLATEFDVTTLNASPRSTLIRGTPPAERIRPRLRWIDVEIDVETKLVRKVVLARVRDGRPLGEVSFTFDGAERQADASYRLPSHLDHNAAIIGPDQIPRRRRELIHFFGSLLLKGE